MKSMPIFGHITYVCCDVSYRITSAQSKCQFWFSINDDNKVSDKLWFVLFTKYFTNSLQTYPHNNRAVVTTTSYWYSSSCGCRLSQSMNLVIALIIIIKCSDYHFMWMVVSKNIEQIIRLIFVNGISHYQIYQSRDIGWYITWCFFRFHKCSCDHWQHVNKLAGNLSNNFRNS